MAAYKCDFLVIGIALLFCFRFSLPLLEPEESRYAELPRQMHENGSWIVPTLDGHAYLDKPPLLYWLVAGTYQLFGVSVFIARIVPSLAAAATVWAAYRWSLNAGGIGAGLASAAILLTMPDFLYRGPMLTMNGLLGLTTTAALASGYLAISSERIRWRWWIAAAIFTGLGVLTKGPVAIALVVGPLVVVPWLDGRLRKPGIIPWAIFAGLVAIVAGPWFAAVTLREPGFVEYFFWKHHIDRVVNPFDHVKPWWYYIPQVLLGMLPWTLVIGLAALRWLQRRPLPPLVLFGLVAGVIGVTLFSISGSKRPVYLVPVYPPLAVAAGVFLWHELSVAGGKVFSFGRKKWIQAGMTVLTTMCVGMFVFLVKYHEQFSAGPVLEQAVRISSDTTRVFAVPTSSPAASFAFQKVVPTLTLESLASLTPPTEEERVLLIVPPRQVDAVKRAIPDGKVDELQHAEMIVLIWTMK